MKKLKEGSDEEGSASKMRGKGKTIRGSGFTYTEEKERTDRSIPLKDADREDIVKLPDLGKKNRP